MRVVEREIKDLLRRVWRKWKHNTFREENKESRRLFTARKQAGLAIKVLANTHCLSGLGSRHPRDYRWISPPCSLDLPFPDDLQCRRHFPIGWTFTWLLRNVHICSESVAVLFSFFEFFGICYWVEEIKKKHWILTHYQICGLRLVPQSGGLLSVHAVICGILRRCGSVYLLLYLLCVHLLSYPRLL